MMLTEAASTLALPRVGRERPVQEPPGKSRSKRPETIVVEMSRTAVSMSSATCTAYLSERRG